MVEGGPKTLEQFFDHSILFVWTQSLNIMDGKKFNMEHRRFENQKVFTFDDNIMVCAKIPNKKASTTL